MQSELLICETCTGPGNFVVEIEGAHLGEGAGIVELRHRAYNAEGHCTSSRYELLQAFCAPGRYTLSIAPGEFLFQASLPNSNSHEVSIRLTDARTGITRALWKSHHAQKLSELIFDAAEFVERENLFLQHARAQAMKIVTLNDGGFEAIGHVGAAAGFPLAVFESQIGSSALAAYRLPQQ